MSRRTRIVVGSVLTVVVLAVVVAAVSTSTSSSTSDPATAASTGAPPAASTTVSSGSGVVVAMGHLDDPENTFYELFDRAPGATAWTLATPPGVADNGGLVVGPSTTGAVTAGFLPSVDLTFSVLAQRAPAAGDWTPADLPGTLAPVPDALATGSDAGVAAVLVRPTPSVVVAGPGLTGWSRSTSATGLAAVSPSCAVGALTAVALPGPGTPVVGAVCGRSSTVGLFARSSAGAAVRGWSLLGPVDIPGASSTRVLRLQAGPAGIVALVEGTGGGATTLTTVWGTAAGPFTRSAPLAVPSGWQVLGTAVGGGDGRGVTVLLGDATGPGRRAVSLAGPGTGTAAVGWSALPSPPTGTTALAALGAEVDAFVPSGSRLTVWSTAVGGLAWVRGSSQTVPIQYGSSG